MPARLRAVLGDPVTLRRLTLASVAANVLIVVTGGVVRLTGSGLGCPTWPRCAEASYTPVAASSWHGAVEFGNRLLTFALVAVAVATVTAAMAAREGGRPRRRVRRLAVGLLLGIPAQAVLGGITVLTGLNPWTVAAHFLLSVVLIGVAVLLHDAARPPAATRPPVGRELGWLGRALVAVTALTVAVGTVVTGSGPHAGDPAAGRTGLDPGLLSQLHADLVMLLVGLTVATAVALRVGGAPVAARRAVAVLVAVEVGQAAIGYAQYFTGVPAGLVAVHLLGAALTWVAAVRVGLELRLPGAAAGPPAAWATGAVSQPAPPPAVLVPPQP